MSAPTVMSDCFGAGALSLKGLFCRKTHFRTRRNPSASRARALTSPRDSAHDERTGSHLEHLFKALPPRVSTSTPAVTLALPPISRLSAVVCYRDDLHFRSSDAVD